MVLALDARRWFREQQKNLVIPYRAVQYSTVQYEYQYTSVFK